MSLIIPLTLRFPGIAVDGQASGIGIPGPLAFGDGIIAESGGGLPSVTIGPARPPSAVSQHSLGTIAPLAHGLPLVGIGIAADSGIAACTLHQNGNSYRVTPGNPVQVDDPFGITATIQASIPALPVGDSAFIAWDAEPITSGNEQVWGWPLRLELYYGAIPQRSGRDISVGRVFVTHDDDGLTSTVYFITDGRSSADLVVDSSNTIATVSVVAIDGKADVATIDRRFDVSDSSQLLAPTPLTIGPNRFVMRREPALPVLLAVTIDGSDTSGPTNGTYQVTLTTR